MILNSITDNTYNIIGAAIAVHKHLDSRFLEAVYQETLEIKFQPQNVFYKRELLLPISYRRIQLKTFYKSDVICFQNISVELKAVKQITSVHESQVINYHKSSGLNVGLLIYFGNTKLQNKRLAHNLEE
jgi:GxxExxY protein